MRSRKHHNHTHPRPGKGVDDSIMDGSTSLVDTLNLGGSQACQARESAFLLVVPGRLELA